MANLNELDLKICATESDVPSGAPEKDQIILVGGESDGVPIGGTSGQILAKQSAADFDTEWIDPPSGGGGTQNYVIVDTIAERDALTPYEGLMCYVKGQAGEDRGVEVGDVLGVVTWATENANSIIRFVDMVLLTFTDGAYIKTEAKDEEDMGDIYFFDRLVFIDSTASITTLSEWSNSSTQDREWDSPSFDFGGRTVASIHEDEGEALQDAIKISNMAPSKLYVCNAALEWIEQTAETVPYDNTDSGLEAADVKGAIDELNNAVIDGGTF